MTENWIHPDRENLTWEVFGEASRNLSEQIVESGWFPDLIVGVARGGLIPAGAIGYAIGVKAMGAINVEFYTDIGQTLEEPIILSPQLDTDSLKGKKVLVVDDVADSGKTLDLVVICLRKPQTRCARPSFIPSRRPSLNRTFRGRRPISGSTSPGPCCQLSLQMAPLRKAPKVH